MKKIDIAVIKNCPREGPGALESLFKEHDLTYSIFDLDAGDEFPNPLDYKALVVLGGPDSANDYTKKMQTELMQIKKALQSGVAYFGICLGLQTLVKAAGGSVIRSPVKEIGFKDQNNEYFFLEKESNDALLEGISFPRPIFHLHGETVELTRSMKLLASGKWCRNQLVKVQDNAYGIQGHMELTPNMIKDWLMKDDDLKQLDKKRLLEQYKEIKDEYEKTGKQLFANFLKITGLI